MNKHGVGELKTRVVIVTGSSSGIGFDVARGFLTNGDAVVINGRNENRLRRAAGQLGCEERVLVAPADIGDPSTGEYLVDSAIEKFGRVDVLVNNAGIFGLKPFLDNSGEELDRYINTNLKGTYFVTQAVVKQMIRQRPQGGSIINIGTVLINHPSATLPASAALITKGGVHALTTSLASELAVDNIRVNAVAPGVIRTPIYGEADIEALGRTSLMKRVGEVADITGAVMHLSEASYTTGLVMPVDGGYVYGRA